MTPGRYRKKPVEIEAVQVDAYNYDELGEIIRWCHGHPEGHRLYVMSVNTAEGTMYAAHDDWIIRGVEGEFYPCKPSVFAATYEPVDGAA